MSFNGALFREKAGARSSGKPRNAPAILEALDQFLGLWSGGLDQSATIVPILLTKFAGNFSTCREILLTPKVLCVLKHISLDLDLHSFMDTYT